MVSAHSRSGSRVLVTGAAGFIGWCLGRALQEQGAHVVGCDLPEALQGHSPQKLRPEHQGTDSWTWIEYPHLTQWLKSPDASSIQAVFHMGACSDTTETRESFLRERNIEASQILWNWCTERKIPFFYASSAATYGNGERGYADDEAQMSALTPLNLYGRSKLLFDLWAIEQDRAGHCPPAWAGFKFFNVYGFGERHKGRMASVVLQAFDQIQKGGTVRLFKSHRPGIGDGEQKRDFVWVGDVVSVLQWAWSHSLKRGVYNLGSGEARTFKDLALSVYSALGKTPAIEFIDTPHDIRDKYQYFTQAEMNRLKQAGYSRSFTSLEEGIRLTVQALLASDRSK